MSANEDLGNRLSSRNKNELRLIQGLMKLNVVFGSVFLL